MIEQCTSRRRYLKNDMLIGFTNKHAIINGLCLILLMCGQHSGSTGRFRWQCFIFIICVSLCLTDEVEDPYVSRPYTMSLYFARVCTLQSPFVFLFLMILIYTSLVSSSSWGLGRAAVCDCGTLWTFLLPFFSHTTPAVCVPCGDPRKYPRTFI